jgi:hypothetical protein
MTTLDPNSWLMGSGTRSAKFETEGDKVVGIICSMEMRQQTDIKSGEPKTWGNGDPMMQMVVVLETDERDDDEDDGMRTLYVKGQMQRAVGDAVRKAGERGLGVGGKLGVQFVNTAAPKQRGFNGAKQYVAKYEAPVMSVDFDDNGVDNDVEPF